MNVGAIRQSDLDRAATGAKGEAGKDQARSQLRDPEALEAEVLRLSTRIEQLELERARAEDFAAMAAHELLQPLVMTDAYAALVIERAGDGLHPDSRSDLDAIVRISMRVRLLVEGLLASARARGEPLRREKVDLSEVVRDCTIMLEPEIQARNARLTIDPMPVLQGDPVLLSGLFSNLLSNALKYGPRTGAEIQLSVVRSEAVWTFAVQSPGPPIPEEASERIFEPWERGPGERRARGAGLGLAIVRYIVERHGGEVGVASPTGESNRFFFTLPA